MFIKDGVSFININSVEYVMMINKKDKNVLRLSLASGDATFYDIAVCSGECKCCVEGKKTIEKILAYINKNSV